MTNSMDAEANPQDLEEASASPEPSPPEASPPEASSPPVQKVSFAGIVSKCTGIIGEWGWVALLFLSICIVGYYTLFPSRGYFHSDCTDTLMWALASHEKGSLFNSDFTYACLLPFGTSLIMTALIPVFGVSMTTHVIGMFCFFALYTGALIWMLRKMNWSWQWISAAVFVELMICSGSEKLREIFWGHTIYYSLGVLFIFVGLSLLFQQMDLHNRRDKMVNPEAKNKSFTRLVVYTALIGIWFLLACMNQIIAIAIFALPVMAAVFCERWLDVKQKPFCLQNRRALIVLAVMGAGMVAGHVLTSLLSKGIVAGYEGAFSNYSKMDIWTDNMMTFPRAWLSLLGATMAEGEKLMSVKSVGDLLTVITGVILLVVPIIALCCYKKLKDQKLQILVLTYWFMVMLIMMGYIMGKLSSANWRLSPIVAMSAVVTVAFIKWAIGQIELQRVMSLLLIPVVLVCSVTAIRIMEMPIDNTEDSNLYAFAEELGNRNLTYGYATFWNANAVTVISDNKVKCRSINIDEAGYSPYYYQGLESWYDDQPGQPQYFLLMSQGEKQSLENAGSPLVEKKVMEFSIRGYTVWVFDENIF